MRSGVRLWLAVGVWLPSCAGGYPLEPTQCDDYCHATKDLQCDYYSPASCVVACEQQALSAPECATQMSAVLACFNGTPGAADSYCAFNYYGSGQMLPCAEQVGLLQVCGSFARNGML